MGIPHMAGWVRRGDTRRGSRRVWLLCAVALPAAAGSALLGAGMWRVPPPPVPLGLPAVTWPAENRYTPEKAELGRRLFFDKRLSRDNTVACATCHDPRRGFADDRRLAVGIRRQKGRRNSPTVVNRAYSTVQFWDGRAPTLEAQAKESIENPVEMDLPLDACVAKLRAIPDYRRRFKRAFGTEELTIDHVAKAIATFERTLLSGDSPFDRFQAGDRGALSASAQRGMKLFFETALCNACHGGPNFTDELFANTGIGLYDYKRDPGREEVTRLFHDRGVFKTPTLREIAHTAPYMHDGSLETLEEVVDYYDKGGNTKLRDGSPHLWMDERVRRLDLAKQEKADLVAFLKSLSGRSLQERATGPTLSEVEIVVPPGNSNEKT